MKRFTEIVHNLTELEVRFLEHKDPELRSLSRHVIPDKMENGQTLLILESTGVRFLIVYRMEGILRVGPFVLDSDPPPQVSTSALRGLEIPCRTRENIEAYSLVLNRLLSGQFLTEEYNLGSIETHNTVFEESYRPNLENIALRYDLERRIRYLIQTGDINGLKTLYNSMEGSFDLTSRFRNNPVRAGRNLAIVGSTMGRLSAEKGGLPPYLLHSLSEKISLEIERLSTVEEINRYIGEIPFIYCDAVRNYGIQNYSVQIVKSCQYILEHLYEKIDLTDLAALTGSNPSYLSRHFHKETGKTITAYIRSLRMREGKWMLIHSSDSITDIALTLGYEDVNYFSRVFRRETGLSPKEFRLRKGGDEFSGLPDGKS